MKSALSAVLLVFVCGCATSALPLDESRFACASQNDCEPGFSCSAGECIRADLVAPIFPQVDGGCPAESDAELCARRGRNCGEFKATDNCGVERTANCGSCTAPSSCGAGGVPNVCGCARETDPAFCQRLGKSCGSVTAPDNCGENRTVTCGTCGASFTCGAVTPNVCGCLKETDAAFCTRLSAECGAITAADNCGTSRTVTCGTCAQPLICGGGGKANRCGDCSTPESDADLCARYGKTCGSFTAKDTCEQTRTVTCGTCTGTVKCGDMGVPNVCTCATSHEACTKNGDCCTNTCRGGLCCVAPQGTCNDEGECCAGICSGGRCCGQKDVACTGPNDCCSGTCQAGKCT